MREPETRYARTEDGAHLAFQIAGEGPHDVVLTAGLTPTESFWDDPEAGRTLTVEGARGREFFVILDGRADVIWCGRTSPSLGPGSFFGEVALPEGGVRSATVSARTRLQVAVLTQREFHDLLDGCPVIAQTMRRRLSARLREAA